MTTIEVAPPAGKTTGIQQMVTLRIWRGDANGGKFEDYVTPVSEGMVVLDALHRVQADQANDLAVRWNCKAGKCGSCSAEINGKPALMCMTQLAHLPSGQSVVLEPMRAFPLVKDLVTDVSWNYGVKKRIKPFQPRPPMLPMAPGAWARPMWTASRSSASASSASSARTSATSFAITKCMTSSSARVSWSTSPRWKCTLSILRIGWQS